MARGKTTTLHGEDARAWVANQAALYCNNQREAYRLLRDAGGEYKFTLAAALARYGFKIPKHAKRGDE